MYGHHREGGVSALRDFKTLRGARRLAQRLLDLYPNLAKYNLSTNA